MTPLRKRFIEDMVLAGFTKGTQQSYVSAVASFARDFGCSPEAIDEEHVRIYFLTLRDVRQVALGTFQVSYSALKFLYQTTLHISWPLFSKKMFASLCRNDYLTP